MGKMLSMGDHSSKLGSFGERGGLVVVRKSAYGKMATSCNSSSEKGWALLSDEKD